MNGIKDIKNRPNPGGRGWAMCACRASVGRESDAAMDTIGETGRSANTLSVPPHDSR